MVCRLVRLWGSGGHRIISGMLALLLSSPSLSAQFIYGESFRNQTAPGWTFVQGDTSPGPRLTAALAPDATDPESPAPAIDNDGNGWLRLATISGNQANAVWLDLALPNTGGTNITVTFDFAFWNADGGVQGEGDGIAFSLMDASLPYNAGAFGGSLGYAQNTQAAELPEGTSGGYLGVGYDVYGFYSSESEGREGGVGAGGRVPNEVAIRGPGSGTSGYEYIAGTGDQATFVPDPPGYPDNWDPKPPSSTSASGLENIVTAHNPSLPWNLDFPDYPSRPDQDAGDFRRTKIVIDENEVVTVYMEFGYGTGYIELFSADMTSQWDAEYGVGVRPEQLRIGFTAGTGGATQVYEIRNSQVEIEGGDNSYYWDDQAGNGLWGTGSNWDQNTVPGNRAYVFFSDQFADTDSPMAITLGSNREIGGAYFGGQHAYTLTGNTLILDAGANGAAGTSYIAVLSSGSSGDAAHTIASNVQLDNNAVIQHYTNQDFTISGNVNLNGQDLTLKPDSSGVTWLNGIISGNASSDLIKEGTGKAILGGDNTFGGTVNINKGILEIRHGDALGDTGGTTTTTVASGATLSLANGITVNNETLNISGAGFNGKGALSNTAGSNIWQGNINLEASSTIGVVAGTTFTHNSSGTLALGNNSRELTLQVDGTANFDRVITGDATNRIIMDGAGVATFSQNSSGFDGNVTIRQGTVQVTGQNNALGDSSVITIGDSGTQLTDDMALLINNGRTLSRSITVDNYGNNVTLGGYFTGNTNGTISGAITLNRDVLLTDSSTNTNGTTFSGIISGTGGITKTGTGTVRLSGNNTFTGDVNIDQGTLRLGSANRIADTVAVNVGASGTFALSNNAETIGSLAGAGTVSLGSATLTTGGNNNSTTYSGVISGSGGITKTGSGVMTFSGANTFTGTLLVNAGAVTLGANDVFHNNADLTLNGGRFNVNGFADTLDNFTLQSSSSLDFQGQAGGYLTFDDMTRSAGTLTIDNWAGNLTGNGSTRLQVTANSLGGSLISNITFTGWGTAQLINLGGGLYEVVPVLTARRWDRDDGTWNNSTGNVWSSDTAPANNSDGTMVYFGNDEDPAGGTQNTADSKTISINDASGSGSNRTVGSMILDGTGGRAYNFQSSDTNTRTLIFDQTGTGTAYLTVGGTEAHVIGSSASNLVSVSLTDNLLIQNNSTAVTGLTFGTSGGSHTFALGGKALTVTGSSKTVIHNQITGTGGTIVKNGTGILELTGSNITLTGGVTLNAGTLQLGSNTALGTGTFTINGGTIQATGGARTPTNAYTIGGSFTSSGSNNLTFSGTGTVNAGTHTMTVTGITHTLSGNLGGSGGLIKDGTGTLELTGGNKTFSGGFTVSGGTANATRNGAITLGASDAANNIAGSGNITVNAGGTFNLTQSGNNAITLRGGSTVANTGGTLNITSTGDNDNRDFFIGTDSSNTGFLSSSGGTTTISVGDDIRLRANSGITVSGGTVNLTPADAFVTEGTSGNASSIAVSGTGTLNVNITGARSQDNQITIGQYDRLSVSGAAANAVFAVQSNSSVNLNGTTTLADSGKLTISGGTTTFSATSQFNGGVSPNKGTLVIQDGNLVVNNATSIVNAPNLTFDVSGSNTRSINGAAAATNVENLGVVTKTGTGTVELGTNLNNLQATKILINEGTLLNKSSDQIENFTAMELAGGKWNTGGHSEVLGSLTLSGTSTLDLASGSSIVQFANSSSTTWATDEYLYIQNWSGNAITGGGTDQIHFAAAGLATGQLNKIIFVNPAGFAPGNYAAIFIGTEIVPGVAPIPEPSTYAIGFLLAGWVAWRERRRIRQFME